VPIFSIIIPCFNVEDTIEQTISSVLNQSIKKYEVIAVNDGSSDKTLNILRSYECYEFFKIINQENLGLGAARNTGIRNAIGEYISLLDADDIWTTNHLEKINNFIELNNSEIISNDEIIYKENNKISYLINKPPQDLLELYLGGNTLSPSAITIKKNIFDSVGLFIEDKNLLGLEDWDFWLRTYQKGKMIDHLDIPLGIYRRDIENMSKEDSFHKKTLDIYRIYGQKLCLSGKLTANDYLVGKTFLEFRRNVKKFLITKTHFLSLIIFFIRRKSFFLTKLMISLITRFIYRQISINMKNLKMKKDLKCIVKELL